MKIIQITHCLDRFGQRREKLIVSQYYKDNQQPFNGR